MAHYLASDERGRGLPYGDSGSQLSGYRFGRRHAKGGRGRSALNRLNGYFKNLIEAVADAKVRRMRHELALRGVRLDQPDEVWIASSLRDRSGGE